MADQTTVPFDFDRALREVTRHRTRRDQATMAQRDLGDRLATRAASEFGPEALETAGLGILLAAGVAAELIREGIEQPAILANVLGFIGERLVRDARAAEEASRE